MLACNVVCCVCKQLITFQAVLPGFDFLHLRADFASDAHDSVASSLYEVKLSP
jgi:hypothetical protein